MEINIFRMNGLITLLNLGSKAPGSSINGKNYQM
jgi:hypothetical protein